MRSKKEPPDFEHAAPDPEGKRMRKPAEFIVEEPVLLSLWTSLYGSSGPSVFALPEGGYGIATDDIGLFGFRIVDDEMEFGLWEKHFWGEEEGMICAFHAPFEDVIDWAMEMKSVVTGEKPRRANPDFPCERRGHKGRYWLACAVRYAAIQISPSDVEMELADTMLYVAAKAALAQGRADIFSKIWFGSHDTPFFAHEVFGKLPSPTAKA
jgi:hypothetical protein